MQKKIMILFLSCLMLACKTTSINIELVKQSSHCANTFPNISIIDNQQSIDELLNNHLLGKKFSQESYNLDDFVYILVSAGSKPTLGYEYQLVSDTVVIDQSNIVLPLQLNKPRAGGASLQIITSPCALLRVEREEVKRYLDKDFNIVLISHSASF